MLSKQTWKTTQKEQTSSLQINRDKHAFEIFACHQNNKR